VTKGVTGMLAPLVACAAVRLGLIIRPTVPRTEPAGYHPAILAADGSVGLAGTSERGRAMNITTESFRAVVEDICLGLRSALSSVPVEE